MPKQRERFAVMVTCGRIPERGHHQEIHFLGCHGNCWRSGGGEETLSHIKQPPGCENGSNGLIAMIAGNFPGFGFFFFFFCAGTVQSCPVKGNGRETNSSFMEESRRESSLHSSAMELQV